MTRTPNNGAAAGQQPPAEMPMPRLRIAAQETARDPHGHASDAGLSSPEMAEDLKRASAGLQNRVKARVSELRRGCGAAHPALGWYALTQLAPPAASLKCALQQLANVPRAHSLDVMSDHLTQSYIALTQTSVALQSLEEAIFGFGPHDPGPANDQSDPALSAKAEQALEGLAGDLEALFQVSVLMAPSPAPGMAASGGSRLM